jgi:uncharacterized protein
VSTASVPSAVTFESWFQARHPAIPLSGASATLRLAGEGATVPFMARYRKEATGNLDEVAIQHVLDAKERWDQVVQRQRFIVEEIERQKKLTPELKEKVLATFELDALEDLYLPYKQKRKTKATLAREAGLEPLAEWIWRTGHGLEQPLEGQTLDLWAFTFRNEEKGFPDLEAVLQGAQDILTERLAETQELRQMVREQLFTKGVVKTTKAEGAKPNSKFERYFDWSEPVTGLQQSQHSHRYLAARRGWMEKELTLTVTGKADDPDFEARMLGAFEKVALGQEDAPGAELLKRAARMALKAHVLPSIESEVHRALKEVADEAAIKVFAENLRGLLLAAPFGPKAVLGVDPGLRTGCKIAVVDDSGKYVGNAVIHLHNEKVQASAKATLKEWLEKLPLKAVAVGNGTAGRETEAFLRTALKEAESSLPVVMVNEAGASVYSASEAAREEFPNLDATVRGAVSIARRLQDPLAELVKIEPRSIGVGQYQHDVSGSSLKKSLDHVVDSAVNQVGVDLNTASYHLLAHVSGIGPALAKAVVDHRGEKGLFKSRQQLFDVPRFSKKTFEQAAGFLRVRDGEHPLDNTGVHPERYAVLEGLAERLGVPVAELLGPGVEKVRGAAGELKAEVGEFTFDDIVRELEKPGRDPRESFVPFQYREDVHGLADLKPGMVCPGIVTNVTNFGAFVDIGVHHDGLVHVSQIADKFVKDPREVVHPGLRVEARVLEVNLEKQQISLSLRKTAGAAKAEGRAGRPRRRKAKGAQPGAPVAAAGTPGAEGTRPSRPPRPRRPRPAVAAGAPGSTPSAEGAAPTTAAAQPPRGPRPEGSRPPGSRPPGPRGDRPRPDRRPDDRPRQDRRPDDRPRPDRRPDDRRPDDRRPAGPREATRSVGSSSGSNVPLNNPFAVLADLKKTLTKGRR